MRENDKQKIISRYSERIERLGHGAPALGEPKRRQGFYFDFLTQVPEFRDGDSVLDIGCGYGDLYGFLRTTGWNGTYIGIDIIPALIDEGRRRYPEAELRVQDIQETPPNVMVDWCICCHALTSNTEGTPFLEHLRSMLGIMWKGCRKGLLFNMLSPLADYTHEVHARPQFSDVVGVVSDLTQRFTLRHDYMPFEYAIYAYKDDSINRDRLIFSALDQHFEEIREKWAGDIVT